MNQSSTFDYNGHEFDYQTDFKQFLEEAKKNTNHESNSTKQLKPETKKQVNEEKKNKKSWKKSLFSWLKIDKKSKSTEGSRDGTTKINKTVRGHYSGPVHGSGRPVNSGRAPKLASGPVAGIFSSRNRVENCNVPYMCLEQLSNSQELNYGPVYLVT